MRLAAWMGALTWGSVAHAQQVLVFQENFDGYGDVAPFSGTGGWVTGYASDGWSTTGGADVHAVTDHDGGAWGDGGAVDNHLTWRPATGGVYGDMVFRVRLRSSDDDGIGAVFHFVSSAEHYVVVQCGGGSCPGPGTGSAVTFTGTRLYRVARSGNAVSATQIGSSTTTYTQGTQAVLEVRTSGTTASVWFDADASNGVSLSQLITVTQDAVATPGSVGLYSYNNGEGTGSRFDDLQVWLPDTDNDGVPNAGDNCPTAANGDQADLDDDRLGDACDPDADGDHVEAVAGDCDDLDPSVHPGAEEKCDGVDQDCDQVADDGALCFDDDGDCACESGPCTGSIEPCLVLVGGDCDDTTEKLNPHDADADQQSSCQGDCDDADAAVFLGAPEQCDGVVTGCVGVIGEAETDQDGDHYVTCTVDVWRGDPAVLGGDDCADDDDTLTPADVDEDGASSCDGDCADDDDALNLDDADQDGATTCDGDCDDADDALNLDDADQDGATTCDGDCDDDRAATRPGAPEACNGIDDDCDGSTDEGADGNWYPDDDGDGHGDASAAPLETCTPPVGYVTDATDCDDTDDGVYLGADEHCDHVDEDCDGTADDDPVDGLTWYADGDGDGFGDDMAAVVSCDPPDGHVDVAGDCDDGDRLVHDGAVEQCNGDDDDCDGTPDDAVIDVDWYPDLDGDGFGDADAAPILTCLAPEGRVPDGADCDDADDTVNPLAIEVCNGADDDCDGTIDGPDAADAVQWLPDVDGDGWGGPAASGCEPPDVTATVGGDCDDADADVSPDATEVPGNGVDEDCDGADLPGEETRTWTHEDTGAGVAGGCDCDNGGSTTRWPLVALLALIPRRRRVA